MIMSISGYSITDAADEAESSFSHLDYLVTDQPVAGAYNRGVISVVTAGHAPLLLSEWVSVVGPSALALVTTGFGDVFYFQPSQGLFFLNVQHASTVFVDTDPAWLCESFLQLPDVVQSVVRTRRFGEIIGANRPLRYLEMFIRNPWECLGGMDRIENYTIGRCDIYLDLVAQVSI
jgi:hypothetical protein